MSRIRLIYLFAILLTPSLAFAQAFGGKAGAAGLGAPVGAGKAHPLMQALDTDSDGTLSAKEIRAAVKALKKLDGNRDGKLTPDELVARPAIDRGKDAAAGGPAGAAAGGKAPGVGGVGAFGGRAGAIRGMGNTGGLGNGGLGNGGAIGRGAGTRAGSGKGLPMSSRQMLVFDKNRDGKVTKQELPPQIWQLYGRYDLNRDGTLDAVELQRAGK